MGRQEHLARGRRDQGSAEERREGDAAGAWTVRVENEDHFEDVASTAQARPSCMPPEGICTLLVAAAVVGRRPYRQARMGSYGTAF